jgi:flagellin
LFANCSVSNRDTGRDVQAIVNGALVSGDGLKISLQDPNLSMQLLLDQSFATVNNSTTSFDITGGGALYQLGGQINNSQQVNIGVQSVAASRLGGTLIGSTVEYLSSLKSGGFNDLNSRNFENASNILASSTSEVAVQRGRLGAFERNTLDTNVRALQAAIENLSSSESRIRDTDFAEETAALSRAQVLASTGTSVLTIANQQAQQVLQLLR